MTRVVDQPSPALALSAGATEYHLLDPQTAGTLPQVDILGMHDTKVRPERREAFGKPKE